MALALSVSVKKNSLGTSYGMSQTLGRVFYEAKLGIYLVKFETFHNLSLLATYISRIILII